VRVATFYELTGILPKCPNTVIVEEVSPNPKVQVWIQANTEYEALCTNCGHYWKPRGPAEIKLTETKTAIPKPKGRA
jgi:hypothetical protein